MNNLDFQFDQFLRALTIYMEHPDINTSFQLQRRGIFLRDAIREHDKEMETRITENVLKALSIEFETGSVLNEIKSLNEALEQLGK